MEKEFVVEDWKDLPQHREPLVQPDTSRLANGTEDLMLEVLDNKELLKEIADGDLKFCREVRFLAILLQMGPEELETFLWMKELPICRVKEVLARMGFGSLMFNHPEFGYGLRALMVNLFDKEVRRNGKKKNLLRKKGKYYIIKLKLRKESKMTKKKKKKDNGVFQDMDMLEMKEVAKGIGFTVRVGSSKKELAEKLYEHIKGLPEDASVPKEAITWFNALDRLMEGEAKTWEEAKAQEAEAVVAAAKELAGEETEAIEKAEVVQDEKIAEAEKKVEKKAAEVKKEAATKVDDQWTAGSSAQICFETMKATGKEGLTKDEAEKKLKGKFETANLPGRIAIVFRAAVQRGIARKVGDKFVATV